MPLSAISFDVSSKASSPQSAEDAIADFATQTEADRHHLLSANEVRLESDDPKAVVTPQSGVGAVIVGLTGEISRSANVLPPRIKEAVVATGDPIEGDDRYYLIEHAERSAIFKALTSGESVAGATMYCTRFPCSDCARAIAWSGIERLVVPTGFSGEQKWLSAQRAALRILRSAGVKVRYFNPAEPS